MQTATAAGIHHACMSVHQSFASFVVGIHVVVSLQATFLFGQDKKTLPFFMSLGLVFLDPAIAVMMLLL